MVRRFALAAAFAALALTLGGCGQKIAGTAIADPASVEPTDITSVTEAPPPVHLDITVAIGECVALGGTVHDATIDNAPCGSPEANYKVIGKAATSDGCISDANQYYYETLDGVPQGALCLDIDWVVGGCMELSGDDPARADCTAPGADTVRVTKILQGIADLDSCPTANGYTYKNRKITVCLQNL